MKRLIVFAAFVCLGYTTVPSRAQERAPGNSPEVSAWIGSHAIPLKSIQADNGFDDLSLLMKILKDVQIVGLGEATHGSREFFQFKHRMLEFLIEKMGFRIFAIEASYPACMNINEYVLYGKGDRAQALASQGFWTWDTNEVSDMIDWMRQYDSRVPSDKKVQFVGFDIQHYDQAFQVITDYLQKVSPDHVAAAQKAFEPLRLSDNQMESFMKLSPERKQQIHANLVALYQFLEDHRKEFLRAAAETEYEGVLMHARILVQFDEAYGAPLLDEKNPGASGAALRDRFMAENISRLLAMQRPGTRMVVWAHNGHIEKTGYGEGIRSMGAHLKETGGNSYYALGFSFYEGSFQSRDLTEGIAGAHEGKAGALKEFTLAAAPAGSVGWYMQQATSGRPFHDFIIDFRSAPQRGPIAKWLESPHPMTSIGSGFSDTWKPEQYRTSTVLRDQFDGLIFIEKTTRARPNPTGMRGPMAAAK